MKFKLVFLLFTLIILVFIVFVTLMPFLMFEPTAARIFWRSNWPFILVMLIILGGLDGFYLMNRRLFSLLEREDWPALAVYLEGKVLRRGKYYPPLVRLLANTWLVLSDAPAVIRLENRIAVVKPSLLEADALIFGVARILGKDIPGAARFFSERLEAAKRGRGKPWIRWYYGFALFLDRQFSPAADQFVIAAGEPGDPLPAGLSAGFLNGALQKALPERREEFREAAAAGRARVLKALPGPAAWEKECRRIKAEIHGAVLGKYLDETGRWLYAQEQGRGNHENL